MTLDYFQRLGDTVLAAWQARELDPAAFADIAASALTAAPPAEHVTPEDIVAWVMRAGEIGSQINLDATFGQPPITLYHHERFYIEALFWRSSTTSIHQHAFAGAFSVLSGSSVQARYDFTPRAEIERRLRFGEVALRDVKILRRGDTERIELGDALIHSVFHLEHPSVTIVVRTGKPLTDQPQYMYYPPWVAFDVLESCPLTTRRLQLLEMLRDLGKDHDAIVRDGIPRWSPYCVFRVLDWVARRTDDAVRFCELLERACTHHGFDRARLDEVFARRRRELIVHSRRAHVTDPELRFFLALLLVLPDRAAIFTAIAEAYPGVDPRAQALAWARRLSSTAVVGVELDELNTILFECLLDGADFPAAARRLRDAYDDDSVEGQLGELAAHYRDLAASEVFQPLFVSSALSGSY